MKRWARIIITVLVAINLSISVFPSPQRVYSQDVKEQALVSTTSQTQTFFPDADAYVASGPGWRDNPRGKSGGLFVGYEAGIWNLNTTRSLLHFDLSSLGNNIRITRAELRLYYTYALYLQENEQLRLKVYPLTAPWDEETVTWNTQPPYDSQRLIGQTDVGIQVGTWITWSLDPSVVQDWIQHPNRNYGIILISARENTKEVRLRQFIAKDYNDATKHPRLVIEYQRVPPTPTPTSTPTPTPTPSPTPRPPHMDVRLRQISESADTLRYDILYYNTGEAIAESVIITNRIPAQVTLIPNSIVGDAEIIDGEVIRWDVGNVAPGGHGVVSYKVRLPLPSPTPTSTPTPMLGPIPTVTPSPTYTSTPTRIPTPLPSPTPTGGIGVQVHKELISPSSGVAVIGDVQAIVWQVVVRNASTVSLTKVSLLDRWDIRCMTSGLRADPPPDEVYGDHLVWHDLTGEGEWQPGEGITVTVRTKPVGECRPAWNEASVSEAEDIYGQKVQGSVDSASVIIVAPTPTVTPTPTQAIPPDAYEPDNSCSSGSWINVGDSQRHNFHQENDIDWVRFYADSGKTYVLETRDLDLNADTVMDLYAPDCVTWITGNDDGGPGLGSRIEWTAASSGVYGVRIRPWYGGNTGANSGYTLILQQTTSESTSTPPPTSTPAPTLMPLANNKRWLIERSIINNGAWIRWVYRGQWFENHTAPVVFIPSAHKYFIPNIYKIKFP